MFQNLNQQWRLIHRHILMFQWNAPFCWWLPENIKIMFYFSHKRKKKHYFNDHKIHKWEDEMWYLCELLNHHSYNRKWNSSFPKVYIKYPSSNFRRSIHFSIGKITAYDLSTLMTRLKRTKILFFPTQKILFHTSRSIQQSALYISRFFGLQFSRANAE